MIWNLLNKKAVITGATRGIVREIASEFLNLGAIIIAVARDTTNAINLLTKEHLNNIYFFDADVTQKQHQRLLLDFVISKFCSIDFLINNAGTNIRKKTIDYTDEELDYLFNLNYKSVHQLCKLFYPLLCQSNSDSIVNLGSIAGSRVISSGSVYAPAKAGLSHLTRYLAVEWAENRIRVNAIEPWYIETPLVEPIINNPELFGRIIERTPLGRIGKPQEVATLAAFLCMQGAGYITGQCITVDGVASCKTL